MSKVSMPRPRYVAFRVAAPRPLPRKAFANAWREAQQGIAWQGVAPSLTRYGFPDGIVRCDHRDLDATRSLLASLAKVQDAGEAVPVQVVTVSTSGTLAALTGRTGVLRERSP